MTACVVRTNGGNHCQRLTHDRGDVGLVLGSVTVVALTDGDLRGDRWSAVLVRQRDAIKEECRGIWPSMTMFNGRLELMRPVGNPLGGCLPH